MHKEFSKLSVPRTARYAKYGRQSAETKPPKPKTHTKVTLIKASGEVKHKRIYHDTGTVRQSNVDAQSEAYTRLMRRAAQAELEWQHLLDAVRHEVVSEKEAREISKKLAAERLRRSPV